MGNRLELPKRLGLNKYEVGKPHISVNQDICRTCREKPCIKVCPAGTYEANPDNTVTVHFERCLECGAALVACPFGSIKFEWPTGGISYRYG